MILSIFFKYPKYHLGCDFVQGQGQKSHFFGFFGFSPEKFQNFPSQMFFICQKKIFQKKIFMVFQGAQWPENMYFRFRTNIVQGQHIFHDLTMFFTKKYYVMLCHPTFFGLGQVLDKNTGSVSRQNSGNLGKKCMTLAYLQSTPPSERLGYDFSF